jgi:hypothetical protein
MFILKEHKFMLCFVKHNKSLSYDKSLITIIVITHVTL